MNFNPQIEAIQEALPGVTVTRVIGSGGQKQVYKAHSIGHGDVALKLVRPGNTERTLREILAASRLSGPYFAVTYKYGECQIEGQKVVYILEEFLNGESIRQILIRKGSLDLLEAEYIGRNLLRALQIVEQQGLVHRDIKPDNVMMCESGRVVLLDFGIARHLLLDSLTADFAPFGPLTPGYGAPEQILNRKRAISSRTDLHGWGLLMYECITGNNPFTSGCSTPQEAIERTLRFKPPDLTAVFPGVDPALSEVVSRCLSKPVHRRPNGVDEILRCLRWDA